MLISLGLDFRGADLRSREEFHPTANQLERFYGQEPDHLVREMAMVMTCNRIEAYAWSGAENVRELAEALTSLARRWAGTPRRTEALLSRAHQRIGEHAAHHLLRVAAGLESQLLGDAEILGQLRNAYRKAEGVGTVGQGMHRTFGAALHTGRRVRAETGLIGPRNSVGAEAVRFAQRRLDDLRGAHCVVVGCGKTGAQAAHQLRKAGCERVTVMNRTPERAARLAGAVGGRSAPWSSLADVVAQADVAIFATSSPRPVLSAEQAARLRPPRCADRPLVLIDLGMPRNVAPGTTDETSIELVDLDRLQYRVKREEDARQLAIPLAERIVAEELEKLWLWVREGTARDAVVPLRETLGEICRREIAWAAGDEIAARTADRIVARVLARPMAHLRAAASNGSESLDEMAATVRALFSDPREVAGDVASEGPAGPRIARAG